MNVIIYGGVLRTDIEAGRLLWGLCNNFNAGAFGQLREIVVSVAVKRMEWLRGMELGGSLGESGFWGEKCVMLDGRMYSMSEIVLWIRLAKAVVESKIFLGLL